MKKIRMKYAQRILIYLENPIQKYGTLKTKI